MSAASTTASHSSYRYVIGALIVAAHLTVGMNLFSVSPLLPLIIQDYGISRASVSLLVSLALLIAAGFGLPGGLIIVRLGPRWAYTLGWAMLGMLTISFLEPGFPFLLVLRLAYGLALALLVTATGPMLMQWFRPKEVLIMNGLTTAVMSLGIALSVSTAAPLADIIGWHRSVGSFGAIGVLGTVAWLLLGRNTAAPVPVRPTLNMGDLWGVLRNRAVILLIVADAGILVQYTALSSWLPSFYNEARDISLTTAGVIISLLPFVGIFAVLLGGVLPLKLGSTKLLFVVPGILAGLGGLGSFLIGNLTGIYISIVVLGVGSWLYVPMLLSLPMQLPGMTPERVAIVWGSFLTFSGFGMFVSPLMVGALRDASGSYLPGFTICAVAAWSLFIAGIFMPVRSARPLRPEHASPPAPLPPG